MRIKKASMLLVLLGAVALTFAAIPLPASSNGRGECEYFRNISGVREFDKLSTVEEDCVYYFLLDKEYEITRDLRSLRDQPPPGREVNLTVDNVIINHVELSKGSTYQFNIYGILELTWSDSRLTWDDDVFGVTALDIADEHKLWTPTLIDHALCNDPSVCSLEFDSLDVFSDGIISAVAHFRYAAYCAVDFYKYPEEENQCCVYFTAFERSARVRFKSGSEEHTRKPTRPVVMQESLDKGKEISRLTQDHSAWIITEQSHGVTNLAGIESLQALKVCLRAEKRMSTLQMALRLPVSIATLLTLVAPLFGDLKTQAIVKLVTLSLQTICFLYLCSIAPPNGFAGVKPKIYRFYEAVFLLTSLSVVVTMCCMALSRAKRTVPPSHRVFLAAKLVNRAVCCIEPEDSAHYQRYLENNENQVASSELTYTQDWRHIYMAVNNLLSGFLFSAFLFFLLLDVF